MKKDEYNNIDWNRPISEIERDYILKAMEATYGSKQRAAKLLGISMRSLRYRLDKANLQDSSDESS